MLRIHGDLWQTAPGFDAVCVTTNGATRRDGNAIMGRGCAKQAATIDIALPALLGQLLLTRGNVVHRLRARPGRPELWSFPVKHHWREQADLDLIAASCHQLVSLVDEFGYRSVLLPRPGCGNGRRSWADVGPVVEPLLDDRFSVIHSRPW